MIYSKYEDGILFQNQNKEQMNNDVLAVNDNDVYTFACMQLNSKFFLKSSFEWT